MSTSTHQNGESYMLSRDSHASTRLTAQHFLLLKKSGWLLHPNIAAKVRGRSELEIADVACGNGIWAMEIAHEYPQARITAIDISPLQFPPAYTCPENVSLENHDIFQPMPDKYVGRFDVVHVRLIVGAVYSQDKAWVIENLLRLVKHGGYLQWTDATAPYAGTYSDPQSSQTFREPPAVLPALDAMFKGTAWLQHLDEELKQHGMIDAKTRPVPFVPWLAKQENDNAIWVLSEALEGLKRRGMTEMFDFVSKAVDEMMDDIRKGRVYYGAFYTTIGQKPE